MSLSTRAGVVAPPAFRSSSARTSGPIEVCVS